MKTKKIDPLIICCAIISIVAFFASINQSFFYGISIDHTITRAILSMEYGIYFHPLKERFPDFITSTESYFIPLPIIRDVDNSEIVEFPINDQTTQVYNLQTMLDIPVDLEIERYTSSPEILIIHTHGTESYANDENYYYEATDDRRSNDQEVSIAKIASILADNLNKNGINTVYSDNLHDYPVYSGSYGRSLHTIEEYLEMYPSVKMVIDVHRDAILTASGEHTYTTVEIDGKECAQLMFVVGTDGSGLDHFDWRDNLNTVINLQQYINNQHSDLMRKINLRDSRFNQHATKGSILLEVGTSGNTLTHAINAIEVFSKSLTEYLLK